MRCEATLQQWQELYQLAVQIRQLEPWQYLWSTELLCIEFAGQKEPVFVSVHGKSGTSPGFVVIRAWKVWRILICLRPVRNMVCLRIM